MESTMDASTTRAQATTTYSQPQAATTTKDAATSTVDDVTTGEATTTIPNTDTSTVDFTTKQATTTTVPDTTTSTVDDVTTKGAATTVPNTDTSTVDTPTNTKQATTTVPDTTSTVDESDVTTKGAKTNTIPDVTATTVHGAATTNALKIPPTTTHYHGATTEATGVVISSPTTLSTSAKGGKNTKAPVISPVTMRTTTTIPVETTTSVQANRDPSGTNTNTNTVGVKRNPCGHVLYEVHATPLNGPDDEALQHNAKAGKRASGGRFYKGGKKRSFNAKVQLDFEQELVASNFGVCCLEAAGPADHIMGIKPAPPSVFGTQRSTWIAMAAGVLGSMMVLVAAASFAHRRHALFSEFQQVASYAPASDPDDLNAPLVYAVPASD
jgi:hypothetical protein